jgi:hypothetical protein
VIALETMQDYSRYTGLCVNFKKTKVIVLGHPPVSLAGSFSAWLQSQLPPGTECVEVVRAFKYLGFMVGPEAGSLQWNEVITKYDHRLTRLIASPDTATLLAIEYNTVVLPVISYKCLLCAPAPCFKRREFVHLQRLLKVPPSTFRHAEFFHLHRYGLPKLRSVSVVAAVAQAGTAARFPIVTALCNSLAGVAQIELPAVRSLRGLLFPATWDSSPFCQYLAEAVPAVPPASVHLFARAAGDRCLSSMPDTFVRSLSVRLAQYARFVDAASITPRFLAQLLHLSVHWRLLAVKTALGAWTTDARMIHLRENRCMFHCSVALATDSVSHYLECPMLWNLYSHSVNRVCRPRFAFSHQILSVDSVVFYAWSYAFYHKVRHGSFLGDLYRVAEAFMEEHLRHILYFVSARRERAAVIFWP